MPALDALLEENPRFVEISYYKGLQAVIAGDLDEADAQLERAYTWRPRWASVANSRGNVLMTAEDFERAADFYDRALALVPDHPEALLGKVRALTFAGRYHDALAAIDALLALERWYIGDARYWRAVNEVQLERHDEAWDDIERAAKLITNADVPKLAGVIAVRRQQWPVARAKFEEAQQRNGADCETSFYLATVLAAQRQWAGIGGRVRQNSGLPRRSAGGSAGGDRAVAGSGRLPERQARQIARREQQLAANIRMRATSWFNTAAGSFNLSRHDEARQLRGAGDRRSPVRRPGARPPGAASLRYALKCVPCRTVEAGPQAGPRRVPVYWEDAFACRQGLYQRQPVQTSPTRCGGTSPSSPTSTTARRRSSTRCCTRAARSARTSGSPSARWTTPSSSASAASPFSRRTRPSTTATC